MVRSLCHPEYGKVQNAYFVATFLRVLTRYFPTSNTTSKLFYMQYRALSNFNSYKQAFCLWVRTLCVPSWSFVLSVSVCLHIYAYHMHSNYITYIVAMQLYLDQLDDCFEFWCVVTMNGTVVSSRY